MALSTLSSVETNLMEPRLISTHCVAKDALELLIFLPLIPECWDYGFLSPHLISCGTEDQIQDITRGSEGFYQVSYIRKKAHYFVNLNVINNPSNNEGLIKLLG